MLKVVIVAFLSLVALGAGGAWAQNPPQPDLRPNIAYGPDAAQQLDLCLPAGAPGGKRPAVVMIHGGYWTVGDKSAHASFCQMAASQGIVAATINYRLANGSRRNRWPAQLVDVQLAVRWLRAHAGEFGVDPARICALGDSAGGHLALMLAALDRNAPGDYAGELASVSSAVACVVDNFGPSDLTTDALWPPDEKLFGSKDREQVKDQERAASPIYLVGPRTPPVMIVHGKDDKSVNIAQSLQLADRLKQDHVPVRLTQFDGGHEFAGLQMPQIIALYQAQLDFIKSARPRP
jgi:acetyl esterase/lipase